MDFKNITNLKDDDVEFLREYTFRILRFRLQAKAYKAEVQDVKRRTEIAAALKNTDLWIDRNIKKRPFLHEFRMSVLRQLNILGLKPWPIEIYINHNQYDT